MSAMSAPLSKVPTEPDLGLSLERLRGRQNAKWRQYGSDVIPAWVAEMDFEPSPAIQEAVDRLARTHDYGYPLRGGERAELAVAQAFVKRMQARFGWTCDAALVQPLSDLIQGTFACILAFSEPGDDVILQIPSYPPFRESIVDTKRTLISHQVCYDGERIDMNIEALPALINERTRILLLCNPHNPSGHVYRRAELEAIGRLVIKHDLIVIADEIHCDLIYPGNVHIPFASLSPEIAARTITLNSATKGFNIPGLRCAVLCFGSAELRERFHRRIPRRLLGSPSSFGVDATVAAWMESDPWLDRVMTHLLATRDHIAKIIASDVPGVKFYVPEATFLAWMDCTALNLPRTAHKFFHDDAGVAFNPGETFDPLCKQYARFNFATSRKIVDEILVRMSAAVRRVNG
jgi:cysteine-S-conjugate beta-lyase